MTDRIHLRAESLTCAVGNRTVLRDVSFEVRRGELVCLVGPNGSGKSTLIRVLAGIRQSVGGSVFVDGAPLAGLRPRQRAQLLALVGQEDEPPGDLLVAEMVALGLTPHRPPWAGGNADERMTVLQALAQMDMAHLADAPLDRLSGGERRRALLARGLAQQCPLLFLDEPTNHLDIRHQHELLATVRALGRTVVVAMHDLDLAATYSDRVAVLHDGALFAYGAPGDVLTPRVIRTAFGIEATSVVHPVTGRAHLLFSAVDSRHAAGPGDARPSTV